MGELARKPGAPELANSPLELLTIRPKRFSLIERYMYQVFGVICGAGFVALENRLKRRPIYAGIYKHIILGAAGWYIMSIVGDWKLEAKMEKDAVLQHYVTLHPDEFPPYKRRRISELFESWTPIR